ncbi:hypothetical protein C1N75_12640 [Curtobacterium sp. SGAir0571]
MALAECGSVEAGTHAVHEHGARSAAPYAPLIPVDSTVDAGARLEPGRAARPTRYRQWASAAPRSVRSFERLSTVVDRSSWRYMTDLVVVFPADMKAGTSASRCSRLGG